MYVISDIFVCQKVQYACGMCISFHNMSDQKYGWYVRDMYEQFDVLVYVIDVLLKCCNTILLLHSVYFMERCNTIVLFMYSPKYSKCCRNKNCLFVYPVGPKLSEKFEKKDLSGIQG